MPTEVVAYVPGYVHAIKVGDILETRVCPVVKLNHPLFSPVSDRLRAQCMAQLGRETLRDDSREDWWLFGGRYEYTRYRMFDTCPGGVEHHCVREGVSV